VTLFLSILLVFGAIVNEIIFFMSFWNFLLLAYRNTIQFHIFIDPVASDVAEYTLAPVF
jgi:hypothetical protein